jgi:hypothetical protein
MALIKQTTDSEIRGLDDKLQTELRLDRVNNADYHEKIAEILKEFRTWRLDIVKESAASDAKLAARQEMVLDLIKSLSERVGRTDDRARADLIKLDTMIRDLQRDPPKK